MIADKDCDLCGAKAGQEHRLLSEDPEWIRKLMAQTFVVENTQRTRGTGEKPEGESG